MKLSKQLRYLVRIRDYETVQVEVSAAVDHYDLGYTDADWAGQLDNRREKLTEELHRLVDAEVDKLAREELVKINQWSEISPNLADDFLSPVTLSPVTLSRSPDANRNQKTAEAPKRSLRRTPTPTPPAA